MALNHTHVIYDNYVLENQIEDQYNSRLDLIGFCTVDNTLEGVAGMTKKIHVYSATDGTEDLAMGDGNSKNIEVTYAEKEYEIKMAQNRFPYYDEELMTDPMVVDTGVNHMTVDMFNHVQAGIYAEFKKAQLAVQTGSPSTAFDFGTFVDGVAKFNRDDGDAGIEIFGLVHKDDVADLRKTLKDDLKYVESFVRTGYIGTVAGVNLYTKKDATKGIIILATKEAVTLFNKKGTEVKQDRVENIRLNEIFSRKYYLPAFTNAKYAVALIKGVEIATSSATATVAVGATVDLKTLLTLNSGSALTWTSATPAKATVSTAGVVTGVATGTSKITATTINGNSVDITVTVTA